MTTTAAAQISDLHVGAATFAFREIDATTLVVEIDGGLLIGNRGALKQRVVDLLADSAYRRFVVDLARAGYIDSSGLGVLASIARKVRDAGGQLVCCGLNADLETLFTLTGLDTVLTVAEDVGCAVAVMTA